MRIELLKVHGSGNDFILIDEIARDWGFTEDRRRDLSVLLCKRGGELGADGILYVQKSNRADARMRIFNSDGSEASMCGNGLRCVARYAYDVLGKDKMIIETMKADLAVEKTVDIYEDIPTFKVEISPVSFKAADLPLQIASETLINERLPLLSDSLLFTALAVPNPHLISIVDSDSLDAPIQQEIAEKVNGENKLFPDGVNVSFVKLLQKGHIYVRTFERGVGFTNACGTAMSASSLVTCLQGMNENETEISVYNNGGKVKCVVHFDDVSKAYTVDLIGNGTYEYKAAIEVDLSSPDKYSMLEKESYTSEISQFEKLQNEVKEYLSDKGIK